jgi:hypothetical protein
MKAAMRIRRVMGAYLLATLPSLALAGTPPNTNMAMGEVEGIIKFCMKTDPRLAKDLEKQLTLLSGQLGPAVRATAQYKQGYDLINDALTRVATPTLIAACGSIVAPRIEAPRIVVPRIVTPRRERPERPHERR